ncbi:MAG: OmpH family outer membrane protein [Lentisphaeria bacterium]|nr:OmpH family outer membrane protein [Lentisphaeria bacterium]
MSFLRNLSSAVLLLAGAAVFSAESRIAVIDLERVFREYYKSRIAEDVIRQQATAYRTYLARLNEELRKLGEAARTAQSNALNIALAPAEKQKVEQEAIAARNAVREKEAEIKLFVEERSADMRRLENTKRAQIMTEIRREVAKRASAEGFEFVIDSSGKTMNDQPALLVYPERCDITNSVLRELNRSRSQPEKKNNGENRK